jgi:siroheme synthase
MSISQMEDKSSLYIIGYGVNFVADRSVIADTYIKDAEIVFAVETDVHHLESEITGRPLVNLVHLYKPGIPRLAAYSQIAEVVIEAFQRFRRVALLVEGSPFFLDSICEILESRAVTLGIEVAFVDGRSSLDVLIQTLAVPLDFGIGVYMAEAFCIASSADAINTGAINLFFQPGNVGSSNVQMGCVDSRGVEILQHRLLDYYSPETRWLLINLGCSPNASTMIIWNYLSRINLFHHYMHSGTLLISRDWWPEVLSGVPATELEQEEER